jgi:hypothetical protein
MILTPAHAGADANSPGALDMKDALVALREACESFMKDRPEFWMLSGLTDASFETQTKNTKYQRSITTFRQAADLTPLGFSSALIDSLGQGVNTNLINILRFQNPEFGEIHDDRPWCGIEPDIRWGNGTDETIVEIKAIYECSISKYYGSKRIQEGSLAKDVEKLRAMRRRAFEGKLFQIVFFRQMPNYEYGPGKSFDGSWRAHGCRAASLNCLTIESQFREARKYLLDEPVWPKAAPAIVPLVLPIHLHNPTILWFKKTFQPDDSSWSFDPVAQLAKAAVSCAIWQY